jgi:general secretion pathway protein G
MKNVRSSINVWATSRRAACRRGSRGVTLVEVLIVVAIMALLSAGVAVFALPKYRDAQITTAKTACRTIRAAIQEWQRANNEVNCPTMAQLVSEKVIDSGTETTDPWGGEYKLNCTEDDVFVGSAGPDKKASTKDDIQIPSGGSKSEG